MKKVILIIIDALTSRVVLPAMEEGRLPNLQALAEAGHYAPDCVTIFPSITHAATPSLVTGRYPNEHGIAGTHWYDVETAHTVYYSTDLWMILSKGLDEFLEDFVIRLNHHWLQTKTIFQRVERQGLQSASINYPIFRGDVAHQLNTPQMLKMLAVAPSTDKICGPTLLGLGDFLPIIDGVFASDTSGGPLNRFGFNDDHTADVLIKLAEKKALPDFTLAYFPDNDYASHQKGPVGALPTVEAVDQKLGEFFAACGGLAQTLDEYCLVITGDHSQSDIKNNADRAGIPLDELLADFSVTPPNQSWRTQDQVIICPNLRMGQIYLKQPDPAHVEPIIERLLSDERVDQVMGRQALLEEDRAGYFVKTADRGHLVFRPVEAGAGRGEDVYGRHWQWQGDLEVVDGQLSPNNILTFPDYPNAFERIATGLDCPTGGHLWLTARPGYEFTREEMSVHAGGGSHGALHASDSLMPLILAGAADGVTLPAHPRSVDVVPLCLAVLGLESPQGIGDSFVRLPQSV